MVSTSQFFVAVAGVGVGVIILRVPREIRKGSTLLHLVGGIAIALNLLTETGKRSFKRFLPVLAGVEPDENYISRLPDDVLCHIISYLDKKDEAQIFVLSRRWRRIYYTLLPNLKFDCHKMIEFATLTEHNNCHRMDKQRFVASVYDMSELLVSLMMHRNCHCKVQDIQKEMPKLSNLEGLSLHVIGRSLDLRDIVSLIAVCPNISTFELSCSDCWLSYSEVPLTCVNLKTVWLDGFKFDAAQMKFASQLVKCAPTLQNMQICTAYCFYPEGKNVEKTLPRKRREFPDELINRTKQQLELEASSPSAVVRIMHDYSTPHVPTQHLT